MSLIPLSGLGRVYGLCNLQDDDSSHSLVMAAVIIGFGEACHQSYLFTNRRRMPLFTNLNILENLNNLHSGHCLLQACTWLVAWLITAYADKDAAMAVLRFEPIYASQSPCMHPRAHICIPEPIYASQSPYMHPRAHRCISEPYMHSRAHARIPEPIYVSQIPYMHPRALVWIPEPMHASQAVHHQP